MTPSWASNFINRSSALWKKILSYRKQTWELRDYPIRIRTHEHDQLFEASRFTHRRYEALIIGWYLAGTGNSRAEAIKDLKSRFESEKFERRQQGKSLPRPGTRVPIEFVAMQRVDTHSELSEDFIRRVLGLKSAWISDDSTLWDFHFDETNQHLHAKIKQVYGVDVSNIESAKLSEIFERIANSQSIAEVPVGQPLLR